MYTVFPRRTFRGKFHTPADNAFVMAVMVKHLAEERREKELFYGLAGAFVFRVASMFLITSSSASGRCRRSERCTCCSSRRIISGGKRVAKPARQEAKSPSGGGEPLRFVPLIGDVDPLEDRSQAAAERFGDARPVRPPSS